MSTRIEYEPKCFSASSLRVIKQANEIIEIYQDQGFTLTLRQLYYQFVSRDLIPNTMQSYKRLGSIINDARMAGHIGWDAIEDRTRNLQRLSTWSGPRQIMDAVIGQYRIDRWDAQRVVPEVWIEKEALVGVIEAICRKYQVPYFACRGYVSQSEQWAAGQRFAEQINRGQTPVILHLGDHDPSGIDMTRDNQARLSLFAGEEVQVERLALNWDQIQQYKPPPNPAKMTDSRFAQYELAHGNKSWELDALEPRVIIDLVESAICRCIDDEAWATASAREDADRLALVNARNSMPIQS
jgi:hypothetical protein